MSVKPPPVDETDVQRKRETEGRNEGAKRLKSKCFKYDDSKTKPPSSSSSAPVSESVEKKRDKKRRNSSSVHYADIYRPPRWITAPFPTPSSTPIPRVIIVGAGPAGLQAGHLFRNHGGFDVVILEARDRIGGRVHTIEFGESPVDLGATFLHGCDETNIGYLLAKNLKLLLKERDVSSCRFSRGIGSKAILTGRAVMAARQQLAVIMDKLGQIACNRLLRNQGDCSIEEGLCEIKTFQRIDLTQVGKTYESTRVAADDDNNCTRLDNPLRSSPASPTSQGKKLEFEEDLEEEEEEDNRIIGMEWGNEKEAHNAPLPVTPIPSSSLCSLSSLPSPPSSLNSLPSTSPASALPLLSPQTPRATRPIGKKRKKSARKNDASRDLLEHLFKEGTSYCAELCDLSLCGFFTGINPPDTVH